MALAAINVTIGQSLGEGRYNAQVGSGALPTQDTTALSTANAAVTTALAGITGLTGFSALSGQEDAVTAMETAIAAVDTEVAALALSIPASASFVYDASAITKRNQVREILRQIERAILSNGSLTD